MGFKLIARLTPRAMASACTLKEHLLTGCDPLATPQSNQRFSDHFRVRASKESVLADDASDGTKADAAKPMLIIGGFVPNKTLAVTGLAFYGVTAAIQWIQHFKIKPRRPFMLTLTIGMTCMTIGFVLRLIFSDEPSSIAKFIIMTMFILLSPCAFLAVDYMLLSHLAATFDREVTDRCLLLRSSRIVKIFMWSDYVTLSLQGNGGGLQVSKTPTLATVGTALVMTGLVVQAISFVFFTYVLVVFGWRIRKHFPAAWIPSTPRPWRILSRQPIDDWRPLFCVMCVTCVGISIRSIFRIVEFSQGHNGYISVHEEYFYLFDALGLWISMTLFCFVWPTRVLYTPPGHVELQPVLKSTV